MARSPMFRALQKKLQRAVTLKEHPRAIELLDRVPELMAMEPHTRRVFLERMGLAALFLNGCSSFAKSKNTPLLKRSGGELTSVAILGAGYGGLTAAYRLSQAGIKCTVYEAADRCGGRVLTKNNFNNEGMFCELGAELIDNNHLAAINLAHELGLKIDDIRINDKDDMVFYFGGKSYTDTQVAAAYEKILNRIKKDVEDIEDEDGNYTERAQQLDKIPLKAYFDSFRKDTEGWLVDLLDVAYCTEFGLDTQVQSAVNFLTLCPTRAAVPFEVFGESDESKRIHGGNSRLTEALEKAVEKKVRLLKGHRLVRIEEKMSQISLTVQHAQKTTTEDFDVVICSLPFTLLRQVEGIKDLDLNPVKRDAIMQLGYGTNSKTMTGFKTRFWRDKKHNGGQFNDGNTQNFWETSREQPGKSGIITTYQGGYRGANMGPKSRLDTIQELEAQYGSIVKKQLDGNNAAFNWSKYKYALGSYSCANVNQVTRFMPINGESELSGKLFFVGEHTNIDFSGYMNGAIESANIVAKELVG